MDIIPVIYSRILTEDNTFANDIWIMYAYSKLPILFGMENITTEEVMDKINMF